MGSSGGQEGRFRTEPLPVFLCRRPLWTILAQAGTPTLWCCPSSISSADHGVAHPPRCPEGWFWRGCRGLWHGRTMQVSVSRQLPEEVHGNPQGSWSCSAPTNTFHQITDRSLIHWPCHTSSCLKRIRENEVEWTGKPELRQAEFPAVDEALKTVF